MPVSSQLDTINRELIDGSRDEAHRFLHKVLHFHPGVLDPAVPLAIHCLLSDNAWLARHAVVRLKDAFIDLDRRLTPASHLLPLLIALCRRPGQPATGPLLTLFEDLSDAARLAEAHWQATPRQEQLSNNALRDKHTTTTRVLEALTAGAVGLKPFLHHPDKDIRMVAIRLLAERKEMSDDIYPSLAGLIDTETSIEPLCELLLALVCIAPVPTSGIAELIRRCASNLDPRLKLAAVLAALITKGQWLSEALKEECSHYCLNTVIDKGIILIPRLERPHLMEAIDVHWLLEMLALALDQTEDPAIHKEAGYAFERLILGCWLWPNTQDPFEALNKHEVLIAHDSIKAYLTELELWPMIPGYGAQLSLFEDC